MGTAVRSASSSRIPTCPQPPEHVHWVSFTQTGVRGRFRLRGGENDEAGKGRGKATDSLRRSQSVFQAVLFRRPWGVGVIFARRAGRKAPATALLGSNGHRAGRPASFRSRNARGGRSRRSRTAPP